MPVNIWLISLVSDIRKGLWKMNACSCHRCSNAIGIVVTVTINIFSLFSVADTYGRTCIHIPHWFHSKLLEIRIFNCCCCCCCCFAVAAAAAAGNGCSATGHACTANGCFSTTTTQPLHHHHSTNHHQISLWVFLAGKSLAGKSVTWSNRKWPQFVYIRITKCS